MVINNTETKQKESAGIASGYENYTLPLSELKYRRQVGVRVHALRIFSI